MNRYTAIHHKITALFLAVFITVLFGAVIPSHYHEDNAVHADCEDHKEHEDQGEHREYKKHSDAFFVFWHSCRLQARHR
jgi:hypothetical protein